MAAMFVDAMRSARPRGRLARLLLGCLASVAVFVLAGEVLARQLGIIDRLNGIPRRLYIGTDIPDLPYRLRPGVTVRVRNFTVCVNRLGLRGPEVGAAPAPGRRRLLVLGDSVVYGEGLDEPDTFPVLLEHELGARGEPSEVLNGAAPGYNTGAELAWLREVGLALRPDAVVVGVSLNDYDAAPVMTPFGFLSRDPAARGRTPWLSNHSEFYMLARWLVTYARGEHWYQVAAHQPPPKDHGPPAPTFEERWPAIDRAIAGMHKRFYAAPSGPGWESVRRALVGLRDLAAARGLDLTLVIFPEKDQIELREPNLDPQRQWLALCTELDLRCLDVRPAFAAAADAGPLFQDTQHPNAAGLRVAARAVAEALRP
jgi:lysophospholipase L1-like esterase